MEDFFKTKSLVDINPKDILLYGPSKLLVDEFLWHNPSLGVIASYTPKAKDVLDHFDVFRGVDQIESFAQATVVSCATFNQCKKENITPLQLKEKYIPLFISVGSVNFHHYLVEGETFICLGKIKFYKFRQMVVDGRIYKVPEGLNLKSYFANFKDEDLENYNLDDSFKLVATCADITGRAFKKDKSILI